MWQIIVSFYDMDTENGNIIYYTLESSQLSSSFNPFQIYGLWYIPYQSLIKQKCEFWIKSWKFVGIKQIIQIRQSTKDHNWKL